MIEKLEEICRKYLSDPGSWEKLFKDAVEEFSKAPREKRDYPSLFTAIEDAIREAYTNAKGASPQYLCRSQDLALKLLEHCKAIVKEKVERDRAIKASKRKKSRITESANNTDMQSTEGTQASLGASSPSSEGVLVAATGGAAETPNLARDPSGTDTDARSSESPMAVIKAQKHLKGHYEWIAKAYLKALEKHRGGQKVLTDEILEATYHDIEAEIIGVTVLDQLEKLIDDVRITCDDLQVMSVDDFDGLAEIIVGEPWVNNLRSLTKDNSKSKKKGEEEDEPIAESFQDKLSNMKKLAEDIKEKVAPILGLGQASKANKKRDLSWLSGRNIEQMTQQDLESFPAFMEELMKELGAQFNLTLPDLKAKVASILHEKEAQILQADIEPCNFFKKLFKEFLEAMLQRK